MRGPRHQPSQNIQLRAQGRRFLHGTRDRVVGVTRAALVRAALGARHGHLDSRLGQTPFHGKSALVPLCGVVNDGILGVVAGLPSFKKRGQATFG